MYKYDCDVTPMCEDQLEYFEEIEFFDCLWGLFMGKPHGKLNPFSLSSAKEKKEVNHTRESAGVFGP